MKNFILRMSLVILWPLAGTWAQVLAPNKAGVAVSHWHTIVRDVEATKKVWMELGGTPIKVDGTDVMKFPGVLVFLTPGTPSAGSKGAVIDHVGFNLLNAPEVMAKLKAAGVNVEYSGPNKKYGTMPGPGTGFVITPDGLSIEMQGTEFDLAKRPLLGYSPENLKLPIVSDHFHVMMPEALMPEVQAWYVKVLGGSPLREPNAGRNYAVDWPGIRVRISDTREPPLNRPPTKGRALDHIGFEVQNLQAYCKKLESMGVKFDQPYSKSRHASFASAELTDPWGGSFELTEGLSKF